MQIHLTLTMNKTFQVEDYDEWDELRDELVEKFEGRGWTVSIENEDSADESEILGG